MPAISSVPDQGAMTSRSCFPDRCTRAQGNLAEARGLLVQSVVALTDIGDLGLIPQMLYTLAAVDADLGKVERAVRLQAAATEMEESIDTRVWPAHRRESDGWWALALAALGDDRYAAAWAEG